MVAERWRLQCKSVVHKRHVRNLHSSFSFWDFPQHSEWNENFECVLANEERRCPCFVFPEFNARDNSAWCIRKVFTRRLWSQSTSKPSKPFQFVFISWFRLRDRRSYWKRWFRGSLQSDTDNSWKSDDHRLESLLSEIFRKWRASWICCFAAASTLVRLPFFFDNHLHSVRSLGYRRFLIWWFSPTVPNASAASSFLTIHLRFIYFESISCPVPNAGLCEDMQSFWNSLVHEVTIVNFGRHSSVFFFGNLSSNSNDIVELVSYTEMSSPVIFCSQNR